MPKAASTRAWVVVLAGGGALLGLGLLLVVMSWLREDPLFWRNAGGYPVWMRETVKFAFVPLFVLQAVGLAAGTVRLLGGRPWGGPHLVLAGVLLLGWMLLGAAGMQAVGNNVANWVSGRPVHWHPGDGGTQALP